MEKTIKTAIVGLRMGREHVNALQSLPQFHVAAVCDLFREAYNAVQSLCGDAAYFTDYAEMLQTVKPDLVCIVTPSHLHAEMVKLALTHDVKAIYCEKPIAICLEDAQNMQQQCRENGVPLIIGHQRRVTAVYRKMKQLIDEKILGDVYLMRGTCPGDLLSDGTHLIDSISYLCGEETIKTVLGQIYRGRKATSEELALNSFQYAGKRYGHNVEEGAMAAFGFATGLRVELQTGTMWQEKDGYQNIEVFGTLGRLRRRGDGAVPAIEINLDGGWKAVDGVPEEDDGLQNAYLLLAKKMLSESGSDIDHPMDMQYAIKGFEALMAIFESARCNEQINLPLAQMQFPLDLMLQEGIVI